MDSSRLSQLLQPVHYSDTFQPCYRFQSSGQATSRRVKFANVVGRLLALRVSLRESVCIIYSEEGQWVAYSLNHLLSPECQKLSSTSANDRM